jgi:hypothetical protein
VGSARLICGQPSTQVPFAQASPKREDLTRQIILRSLSSTGYVLSRASSLGLAQCLHQRWNEGCANVRQLHAELRERGYKGSYGTIRDYVLPFRESGAAPPAVPGPPKARDLASRILTDPGNLGDDEKEKLARARERCPHIDALAGHVTEFAKILTGLHGDRLDDWLTAVEAGDQPGLHSFARGIKHDHQAVLNGLTMPWSSGVVEGNVNRLKTIKRQMYGRATFPLLRKRVLLS